MQYIFRFFVATQCVALSNVRKKFVADATGPNANNITLLTTADWRDRTVVTCVRNVLSSTKKA